MTTNTSRAVFAGFLASASIGVSHSADVETEAVTYANTVTAPLASQNAMCQSELDSAKRTDKYPTERLQLASSAKDCFSLVLAQSDNTFNLVGSTPTVTDKSPALAGAKSQIDTASKGLQDATNTANTANSQANFLGVNFALGAGYAFGQGPKRVTASVVNNIVRVSSDVTNGPRVFLEAHYYPEFPGFTNKAGTVGWGPFATFETGAAGSTASNGITGFGLGLMGGFKVPSSSSGFNIGVGYLWEGDVQTLGDGIAANQPLPTGETQVRYKNRSVGALAVLFSYKFGNSIPSDSSAPAKKTP